MNLKHELIARVTQLDGPSPTDLGNIEAHAPPGAAEEPGVVLEALEIFVVLEVSEVHAVHAATKPAKCTNFL